jgi:tRNA threonylcarbamoyl adenosine modification protein (Sua5/YciO/YrdC/YwlC family)
MLLKLYAENTNPKHVEKVTDVLTRGGIVIYPTDTVYGMGCDIFQQKTVEKIARLRGINPEKAQFSFICHSLSQLSDYCKVLDNNTFKLMRKNLPGPFTFIVQANNQVPKLFKSKKKTVGIRIPDNPILLEIVRSFGRPILNTSVRDEGDVDEYMIDPELIYEKFKDHVDLVVDGDLGRMTASTIVDCTGNEPVIIRQGAGILEW